jgi:hypothetical protein
VNSVLIDIVLVGIVAFAARKRVGRQRVVDPAGPARQTGFVPREPPKAGSVAAPTRAATTDQAETSAASPTYLVGGQRAGGRRDSMAETLAMMSGPGICTPRPR